jgi:hypothetical protein
VFRYSHRSIGSLCADLTREEFTILEDGVKQDVAFFATVTAPFHVVLMLDNQRKHSRKTACDS